ncbi:MAG: hypothetical protein ACR2LF_08485 [Jatrophihabitantaceae bacterium]
MNQAEILAQMGLSPASAAETPQWDRPADQIRDRAEAAYTAIRNNGALSDTARQAMIAAVYLRAQADMAKLQETAGQASGAGLAALKRAVFGNEDLTAGASPAEQATIAVSFRDAQARAAQTSSEAEAAALLEQAEQSGDELLARAVGSAALTGGLFAYQDVADRYLAARPDKAAAWNELQAASRPQPISTLWEFVVPEPPELAGLGSRIAALAAQAGTYQQA